MRATLDGPLAIVLDRTGDGAFATDANGIIVGWNTAAERLLGYSAREVKGRACCQILDGYDAAGNRLCFAGCQIATLLRREEPVQSFEMRTRTKSGRPLWLSISVLSTAADRAAGLTIHLLRDITATKELLTLVHERLDGNGTARNGNGAGELTRRELEILRLLTEGLNTAGAAERLHVSRATVRNHVQNIFAKLGVHSRLEAVAYATRHRLF
jgi:PAS domain S-box-containing protein